MSDSGRLQQQTPEHPDAPPAAPADRAERSPGSRLFLLLLGVVSVFYAVILIYHASVPPGAPGQQAFLEQCRQVCLKYGLVSTGHVKHDAEAYLTAVNARPLSSDLHSILEDPAFTPEPTQTHPLLGQHAPDFELLNEGRNSRKLSDLLGDGPVLLVFYYGFSCSHCVAQLYAIDKDLSLFEELGVRVVAISQDKPEHTAAAFAEYGRLPFTVLSDPENRISEQYSCSEQPSDSSAGFLKHGTFLLDADGTVVWAYRGFTPFVDNKSLLRHAAKLRNVDPATIASK